MIDPSFPFPLKIKSKIHDEVSEASRQFPTTTSHSFQAAMFTRSIHPQNSGLSVSPRALSPSLFFSLQYPELLSVQSASTIGPRRKTFIFFRGQTYISFHFQRTIFPMILITRHGLDLNLKYRAPRLSKKPGIASKRRETKYSYELYFVFLFRDKELVLLIK